jgi:predicted homoserine dehydrogenase-like protein
MATNVHLTGLARDLAAREEAGKPIRIGVIGSGEMGTDLVTHADIRNCNPAPKDRA